MGENDKKPTEAAGEINEPAVETAADTTVEAAPGTAVAAAPEAAPGTILATSGTEPSLAAPKKKKTGVLVAGVVVALGLGGFGVAYALDTQPENIAVAAVSDFLNSKAMSVNGVFEISQKSSDLNVKLELNSNNTEARDSSAEATLIVSFGGDDIKVSLGTVVLKDYTAYIKLDGLKKAADTVMELMGMNDSYSSYGSYNSYNSYNSASLYKEIINSVVGEIDGTWWKISVPELIDDINELSSSEKGKAKEAWQCVVDAANRATEKQGKYADIYKSNAFVSLKDYKGDKKPSGNGTAYVLSLDAAKLTKFSNEMAKEADDLGLNDCISKINGNSGGDDTVYDIAPPDGSAYIEGNLEVKEVNEEQVKAAIAEMPEIILTVENGLFSHKLTGLYIDIDEGGFSGKVDFTFNKDVKAVSAPADAKPVKEVVENIIKAVQKTSLSRTKCNDYGSYSSSLTKCL